MSRRLVVVVTVVLTMVLPVVLPQPARSAPAGAAPSTPAGSDRPAVRVAGPPVSGALR
ncbi:hypothetical protein [Micromonospora sp. NBRC 101691]|uniref:hypothetical protein n=1 Tax=Micromonospora sp. NBRC 101691 TaxID=3032198 RepID=UPI0025554F6E|nr:hypothetical protein [Micromonospora sp. NBRC 101691]